MPGQMVTREGEDDRRHDGDERQKDSAGKRDLVERVLDVGRGSPTRTHARNKAALLLKVIGRVIGVEHHGGVEVREEHDEDNVKHPVEPTGRKRGGNCLNPADAGEEHGNLSREVQQRRSEDDRHDTRGVDLDGQVGGLATIMRRPTTRLA